MALSEEERKKVIEFLDLADEATKRKALATLEAFIEWMNRACTWIYLKVRNFISDFYSSIKELFSQ